MSPTVPLPSPQPTLSISTPIISDVPHCTTSITSTNTVHITSDHLWCPPLYHFHHLNQHCPYQLRSSLVSPPPPTVPLPSPQPTLSTSTPIISGVPHCTTSITSTNTVHINSDHLWCPPPPLYHFHHLNQHCPHQPRSSLVSPTVPLPSPQPTLSTSTPIISGVPHCTTSITSINTVHINSDHLWCPPLYHFHHLNQHCPHQLLSSLVSPPPTVPLPSPQPTLSISTPIISGVPPPLYHFHHLNQHCPHQPRSSLVSPPPTVPLPSPQPTLSTSTPIICGVPHCTTSITSTNTVHINSDHLWCPPLYHFHHLNQHCPHQLRSYLVSPTVPLPSPQPTLSTSTPIISGVPHCTTSITSTNTVHINSDHLWCPPLYHFHHLNQHCPHQLRSSLVSPTVPLPSPQPTLSISTPIISGVPHCTTSITSTNTVHTNSDHLWCPPLYHFHHLNQHCPYQLRSSLMSPTVPLPSPQPTLSTSTPIICGVPHCTTSITSTNTVHINSDHLWCPPPLYHFHHLNQHCPHQPRSSLVSPPPHCTTSITSTNTVHINPDNLWCPPLYHFHHLNQHCPHQLRSSLMSPTVPLPSPQPTLSISTPIICGVPHCTTSITSTNTVHINSDHLWCPPLYHFHHLNQHCPYQLRSSLVSPTVPLPSPQPTLSTSTPIICGVPHCTTSITSTNTVHINSDHLWCPPLYHFHHLNQHCPHQLRSYLVSPPLYHFHHLNQHCPHQLRSYLVSPTVPLPSPQPTLSTSTPIISDVPPTVPLPSPQLTLSTSPSIISGAPPHCTTSITSINTVHINSDHLWCPPPTVPLPSPQLTLSTSTPIISGVPHCTTSITSTITVHINSDHLWCPPLYHFHHLNHHCPHQPRSSLVSPTVPLPLPQPTLSTSTPIISGVPHCTTSITSTTTVHINFDHLWCPPLYHFHHLNQHCPHQLRSSLVSPTVPLPSPQPTLSTSTPIISDVPHCTTSITSTNTVHINPDHLWCPPLYHFHHLNQHCPHQPRSSLVSPTVSLPSPQPTLSTSTPIISGVPPPPPLYHFHHLNQHCPHQLRSSLMSPTVPLPGEEACLGYSPLDLLTTDPWVDNRLRFMDTSDHCNMRWMGMDHSI